MVLSEIKNLQNNTHQDKQNCVLVGMFCIQVKCNSLLCYILAVSLLYDVPVKVES